MKQSKLKNGLPYIIIPSKTDLVTISFAVNVGSNDESPNGNGISHFLEHLIFEGTKKYRTSLELNQVIDNFGGELNAMTSKNRTTVYLKVPKKFFKEALSVVSDMIIRPTFKKEIFEKEKQVVLHEIEQTYDEPRHYQWLVFEEALFKKHPAKQSIAGTTDIVSKITIADVKKHHSSYYTIENSLLVVNGNVGRREIALCEAAFADLPHSKAVKKNATLEKNTFTKKNVKKDIQLSHFIRGYKVPASGTKDGFVLEVIEAILSKGQTGWMFDEFRIKRGLAYEVRAHHESENSGSFFALNVITQKKNLALTRKLINELCVRLQTVDDETVTNAKNNIYGKHLLSYDESISHTHIVSENYFDNVGDYLKSIEKVTTAAVRRVAKKLFTKEYTEIVLGK